MSSNDIPTLLLRLSVVVATIQHQLYCGAFGVSAPSWLSSKLHVNIRSPPARASRPPSRYHHSTEPRTIGTQPSTGWPSAGYAPASGWSGPFFGDLGTNSVSTNRGRGSQQVSMTAGVAGRSTSITAGSRSVNWPLWYVLPIAPYQRRKTLMKEVVPGKVWTFDQLQGVLYVIVPVRMTVIKLEDTPGGGLFVYAPVAPTGECMSMMRELEAEHGPVRHIVLGTLGLEHKVFAGPFAQRFSQAQVWFTPGQYSFPIGLPLSWLGFGGRPTKEIPASAEDAPWAGDLDHAVLGPFFSKDGSGGYGETAFFHKETKTLLVTDMVVSVEDEVPDIVAEDPRPLLFHARDNASEKVENTEEVRLKGWRRVVQFALTFQPSSLVVVDLKQALSDASGSKMKELGWGGLFPFEWKSPSGDLESFTAMQGGLLVAPILQVLLLNRDPGPVLDWADRVAKWPFRRVIPCHLANDVATTPQEFRKAFRFLEKGGGGGGVSMGGGLLSLFNGGRAAAGGAQPLAEDFEFLRNAEKTLVDLGTLFPAAEPVDRTSRR